MRRSPSPPPSFRVAPGGRLATAPGPWIPILVAILLAVGCNRDYGSPSGPRGVPTARLDLTLELADPLPTFKVDGRLRLVWEYAARPVGGRDLGIVVLPADERRVSVEIDVPIDPGRLVAREETLTPLVPFLCGSTGIIDPRETGMATVVLDLCLPE